MIKAIDLSKKFSQWCDSHLRHPYYPLEELRVHFMILFMSGTT